MSVSQVPATSARFTLQYFSHLDGINVLDALLCLTLAHRAKQTARGRVGGGVLDVDEVEHGDTGRTHVERRANEWRDGMEGRLAK